MGIINELNEKVKEQAAELQRNTDVAQMKHELRETKKIAQEREDRIIEFQS